MTSNNLKRHQTTCKGKNKKKKERKKKESKGRNFFLTFQTPIKYKAAMRLFYKWDTGSQYIQQVIIGNEWGVQGSNGHSHAFVCTKEKMNFKDFTNMWTDHTSCKPDDVQSAKNVKCAIKYVSKEDVKCVQRGIDQDLLSLQCKAYIGAYLGPFRPNSYPYMNLTRHEQVRYKELFDAFREDEDIDHSFWDDVTLYIWQKTAIEILKNQNNREVMWIVDPEGNHGKTVLAKYLSTFHKALRLPGGKSADMAFAYQKQPIVIFDFTREKADFVNYSFIEELKNGELFSPKYQSHAKRFKPPKVLCLSNFEPDITKLSHDRWVLFDIHVVNQAVCIKRRT